jgi:hypothetical protein
VIRSGSIGGSSVQPTADGRLFLFTLACAGSAVFLLPFLAAQLPGYEHVGQALPTAIAAKIIRGDPTPATTLTALPNPTNPAVGSTFTLTARVQNPAFEAYGVHIAIAGLPSGVTLLDANTTREDGVPMTFSNARGLTLGSIVEGDSRSATWRFRMDTPGPKTFRVRSWSDNGGSSVASVTVSP